MQNCKPATAAFNYIYIVCKTDMARNWRIYHQTQVKGNI